MLFGAPDHNSFGDIALITFTIIETIILVLGGTFFAIRFIMEWFDKLQKHCPTIDWTREEDNA